MNERQKSQSGKYLVRVVMVILQPFQLLLSYMVRTYSYQVVVVLFVVVLCRDSVVPPPPTTDVNVHVCFTGNWGGGGEGGVKGER